MNHTREEISITLGELRALVFWATQGVRKAKGGSYEKTIEGVLAKFIPITKLELEAKFGAGRTTTKLSLCHKCEIMATIQCGSDSDGNLLNWCDNCYAKEKDQAQEESE